MRVSKDFTSKNHRTIRNTTMKRQTCLHIHLRSTNHRTITFSYFKFDKITMWIIEIFLSTEIEMFLSYIHDCERKQFNLLFTTDIRLQATMCSFHIYISRHQQSTLWWAEKQKQKRYTAVTVYMDMTNIVSLIKILEPRISLLEPPRTPTGKKNLIFFSKSFLWLSLAR